MNAKQAWDNAFAAEGKNVIVPRMKLVNENKKIWAALALHISNENQKRNKIDAERGFSRA